MPAETHLRITPHLSIPVAELVIRTSRSSGPGGQHVNKVETKVEILFDVVNAKGLSPAQRQQILEHLAGRIDSSGYLRITEQRSRSQYENKKLAMVRVAEVLRRALKPVRTRVPTRPTRTSKDKRMESKRRVGEKKRMRKVRPE